MRELMYDQSTGSIALVLLISMLLAIEAGFWIGRRHELRSSEAHRSHVNAIQASVLGILALLLGFSFSLALQRFDQRTAAVVDEANAIGTAYLRSHLLPLEIRQDVQQSLRDYIGLRIQSAQLPLDHHAERDALLEQSARIQAQLWEEAQAAHKLDPGPVTTGLYIQALNDLIDAFSSRNAALKQHVPELVLLLLYGVFVIASGILGYSSGLGSHRPSAIAYIMVVLMVLLVFVIIDLDRPRRGLIQVDQSSLLELRSLAEPVAHPP